MDKNIANDSLAQEEISFSTIFEFLRSNFAYLAAFSIAGIVLAFVYLRLVTPQFEGVMQIKMAQMMTEKSEIYNIEDPALLISKLKLPATYTADAINACGLASSDDLAPVRLINASVIPGFSSAVEIRLRLPTRELAKICLDSVANMVARRQEELREAVMTEFQKKLSDMRQKLKEKQKAVTETSQVSSTSATRYLVIRDEIKFLQANIFASESRMDFDLTHKTRIITPSYVFTSAVFPKKAPALILGMALGFLVGMFFGFFKKMLVVSKS